MNTANKLTMLRVVLIPVFLLLLYLPIPFHRYFSLAIFILASVTDFIDGYVAYVEGDELQKQRIPPLSDQQDVFAAWRTANGIGEEVQLLSCTTEDGGAQLTVTANLADYSASADGELLLESLRQTMGGYVGLPADACQITLE